MKSNQLKSKLTLNKETVLVLSHEQLSKIRGGENNMSRTRTTEITGTLPEEEYCHHNEIKPR